jgi:uncharacterized membrane protein HdeD (DUF308 family)
MTIQGTSSPTHAGAASAPTPAWLCALLGVVLIVAGFSVLGDVVLFTIVSAIFIGLVALIAGAFEIVHAFWTKGWGGFVWQIVLGLIYVAFGLMLLRQPVSGALALTYIFGLLLLVSGAMRVFMGFTRGGGADWIMILSGVFGLFAGLVILTGWPLTGLWMLGFLLGVDLIFHGVAWLAYAWRPAARTA